MEASENDTLLADASPAATEALWGVQHAPARVIEYYWGHHIALPMHMALAIIEKPSIVEVPGSPYYALGMMRWQDRWISVIDLHALFEAYRKASAPPVQYVVIVAYQRAPRQPVEYGALASVSLPRTAQIHDGQASELPKTSDLWPLVADSCFSDGGKHPVPIINTSRIFATVWS